MFKVFVEPLNTAMWKGDCVGGYACECRCPQKPEELDLLELSYMGQLWVLEVKHWSPEKAVYILL